MPTAHAVASLIALVTIILAGLMLSSKIRRLDGERFSGGAAPLKDAARDAYFDNACRVSLGDGSTAYRMTNFDGIQAHPSEADTCVFKVNAGDGLLDEARAACVKSEASPLYTSTVVRDTQTVINADGTKDVKPGIGVEQVMGNDMCVVRFKSGLSEAGVRAYEDRLRTSSIKRSAVYRTLDAKYTKTLADIARVRAEIDRLRSELAALDADLANKREKRQRLENELASAKMTLEQLTLSNAKLQDNLAAMTKERDRLQREVNNKQSDLDAINREVSVIASRRDALANTVRALESEIAAAQAEQQQAGERQINSQQSLVDNLLAQGRAKVAAEAQSRAAVQAARRATVYQHCNYGGWSVDLPEGRFSLADLRGRGFVNDDMSALKVSPGYQVTLYEHDFAGRSRTYTHDVSCLVADGLNDTISSIVVEPVKQAYYKSRVRGNFCVDVSGVSKKQGAQVYMWDCWNGPNQRWKMDSKRRLVSENSGMCLDVYESRTHDGAGIIQWPCHDGGNQKWTHDGGMLRPDHAPGKCLDVYAGTKHNGSRLVIWKCHGGANQRFDNQVA